MGLLKLIENGLLPVFTETELQIDRKSIQKNYEAEKPKYIFEYKHFQKS